MYFKQILSAVLAFISIVNSANVVVKRGLLEPASAYYGGFNSAFDNDGYNGVATLPVLPHPPVYAKSFLSRPGISPGEIATAIQAAKEASSLVMDSQRRVQEAKEAVLHQQHVASQKQAQAALALQKTEAAAAVQQQEAKAAATGLVLAQQRLAQAKAEVAEHQKIAAIKEANAAAIIQKSASLAAANIQKTDEAARKLNALQYSGSEALRQAASSKDGSLSATSAAVAAAGNADRYGAGFSFLAPPKYLSFQPWG